MSAPPPVDSIGPQPRVHSAPIVHPDNESPESKMAVDSKRIQLQLVADTQFDQKAKYAFESFQNMDIVNDSLFLLMIAAFFATIVCWKHR